MKTTRRITAIMVVITFVLQTMIFSTVHASQDNGASVELLKILVQEMKARAEVIETTVMNSGNEQLKSQLQQGKLRAKELKEMISMNIQTNREIKPLYALETDNCIAFFCFGMGTSMLALGRLGMPEYEPIGYFFLVPIFTFSPGLTLLGEALVIMMAGLFGPLYTAISGDPNGFYLMFYSLALGAATLDIVNYCMEEYPL